MTDLMTERGPLVVWRARAEDDSEGQRAARTGGPRPSAFRLPFFFFDGAREVGFRRRRSPSVGCGAAEGEGAKGMGRGGRARGTVSLGAWASQAFGGAWRQARVSARVSAACRHAPGFGGGTPCGGGCLDGSCSCGGAPGETWREMVRREDACAACGVVVALSQRSLFLVGDVGSRRRACAGAHNVRRTRAHAALVCVSTVVVSPLTQT